MTILILAALVTGQNAHDAEAMLRLNAAAQAQTSLSAPQPRYPVCEECGYNCECVNCGCGVRRSLPENPIVTYRWVSPAQVTTQGTLFQPARAVAPQPQFYFTPQPAPLPRFVPATQPAPQRPVFQFYQPAYSPPPVRPMPVYTPVPSYRSAAPARAASSGSC